MTTSTRSRARRSRILYRRVLTECGGFLPAVVNDAYVPWLVCADLLGCELLKPVLSAPRILTLRRFSSPCTVKVTRSARFLFRVKLLHLLCLSSSRVKGRRLSLDSPTEELAQPFLELVAWFWDTMWPVTTLE